MCARGQIVSICACVINRRPLACLSSITVENLLSVSKLSSLIILDQCLGLNFIEFEHSFFT